MSCNLIKYICQLQKEYLVNVSFYEETVLNLFTAFKFRLHQKIRF